LGWRYGAGGAGVEAADSSAALVINDEQGSQPGPAISGSANFHDREDFCVLCHIKVFAIMKFSLLSSY
jgi:hypothetical protein